MSYSFSLSFEFFPPKSLSASFKLWNSIDLLSGLAPDFVSVTYGAGGSTRDLTRDAVGIIRREYGLNVAGHLTCVAATKDETLEVARHYAASGAKRIVALRGDPQDGSGAFQAHPNGFKGSLDLIAALRDLDLFHVSVAAYPKPHPEAASAAADLDHLKAKFDAGAQSAITQFFFEAEDFLRFRDKAVKAGVHGKIIPGILPIENWARTRNFAARCGVTAPEWMDNAFSKAEDLDASRLLATALCTEMCDDLLTEGVSDLHIYTLNDAFLTAEVCRALGREMAQPALAVAS